MGAGAPELQVLNTLPPPMPRRWPLPCPIESLALPISWLVLFSVITANVANSFAPVRRYLRVHGRVQDALPRRQEVLAQETSPTRRGDERQAVPAARFQPQAALQAGHEPKRHVPALQAKPEQVSSHGGSTNTPGTARSHMRWLVALTCDGVLISHAMACCTRSFAGR